jgi:hypothetical protein
MKRCAPAAVAMRFSTHKKRTGERLRCTKLPVIDAMARYVSPMFGAFILREPKLVKPL